MPKTIYYVASSLDGFIADARGKLDWLTQFDGAEGTVEKYEALMARVGALVMGAETYAFVLGAGGPWPYPKHPSWVFTRRKWEVPPGADVRFVSGEVQDHVEAIEASAGGRDVLMVGGGGLAAQYLAIGRLHELHLNLVPMTLGAGAPLLPALTRVMQLDEVTRLGRGLVELRYSLP